MANTTLTQTGAQVQKDLNLTENLQDAFSTSATYKVNDLVIYDGKLWRCHTDITSAGSWTGTTNWQQVKLANLPINSKFLVSNRPSIYEHDVKLSETFGGYSYIKIYSTSRSFSAGSYLFNCLNYGCLRAIGMISGEVNSSGGDIIYIGYTTSGHYRTYKYLVYKDGTSSTVSINTSSSYGPTIVLDRVNSNTVDGANVESIDNYEKTVTFYGDGWYDQTLSYKLRAELSGGGAFETGYIPIPYFPFTIGLEKGISQQSGEYVYNKIKFKIDGVNVYYSDNQARVYVGKEADWGATSLLTLTGEGVITSEDWIDAADNYYFEGTGSCLTGDSLIMLTSNFEARVDEIANGLCMTSYDLETGELVEDITTNVDNHKGHSGKFATQLQKYTFSDGTVIKEVIRHRFLNLNRMEFINLCDWEIGDKIYKIDGTTPSLVKKEIIEGQVEHFTVTSQNHHNGFINGCLFGDRKTQKYKIVIQDGKPVYDKSEPHTVDYLYGEIK